MRVHLFGGAVIALTFGWGVFLCMRWAFPCAPCTDLRSGESNPNGSMRSHRYFDKPLNKESLGRAGWSLLHTLATNYAENPSASDKAKVTQFLTLFGELYPCRQCSGNFVKMITEFPPDLTDRDSFKDWLNAAHNRVNRRLGKPQFPKERVDERWYNPGFGLGADERKRKGEENKG